MGLEQDIRRAGELLIEVKDRLKWGEFMPWLTEHGIPDRTARHDMRLARESATVADLPHGARGDRRADDGDD